MKKEVIGNAVLYLADCLTVSVECQLLLTDPPYGVRYESGRAGGKWGQLAGDDDCEQIYERLLHALKGVPRSRHAYIFGGFDTTRLPLCGVTELVWDKQIIGMGDLSLPWGKQHEKIIFGVHQSSKANRANGQGGLAARLRKGTVLRSKRPHSAAIKHHPTEKPVDILRELIESSSVMGDTVYDPFMGSGSTLVAALLEGRQAVGCEIDERYFATACERVSMVQQRSPE